MNDLLFREEGFVFSCRVGGVLTRNGKTLLQRHRGDYALIGGHVNALEDAKAALAREFREELQADVTVGRLLAVGEVFFHWGEKPCHQLFLTFEVELTDPGQLPGEEIFHGWDELGGERFDLEYCWVPLPEVEGLPLYPPQMKPVLRGETPEVLHFVYREET